MLICIETVYLDVLFLKHFKSSPFSCSTLVFSRHFTINYSFLFRDFKERKIEILISVISCK